MYDESPQIEPTDCIPVIRLTYYLFHGKIIHDSTSPKKSFIQYADFNSRNGDTISMALKERYSFYGTRDHDYLSEDIPPLQLLHQTCCVAFILC